MNRLTEDALNFLKNDGELFGIVADALGVKPLSMPMIIQRNSRKLTELPVVKLIAEKMRVDPDSIIRETKLQLENENCN